MRTVIINENILEKLKAGMDLSQASMSDKLVSLFADNKTMFSNSKFIPDTVDDDYLLTLLDKLFEESKNHLKKIGHFEGTSKDIINLQSELITKAQELERPIRQQLEKLCFTILIDLFEIPENTINFEINLVDEIDYNEFKNLPVEKGSSPTDGMDIPMLKQEIEKRRFIESVCVGAGIHYSSMIKNYVSDLYDLNSELAGIYRNIIAINTYLAFVNDDFEITDENKSQLGVEEVVFKENDEIVKLRVHGKIFPILLSEAIRGLMEIFASQSLPDNVEEAEAILSRTSYLKAEPIYMILGHEFFKSIGEFDDDTTILPYYFSSFCNLNYDNFIEMVRECLSHSEKAKHYQKILLQKAKSNKEMDSQANIEDVSDKTIITDEYMREEEF